MASIGACRSSTSQSVIIPARIGVNPESGYLRYCHYQSLLSYVVAWPIADHKHCIMFSDLVVPENASLNNFAVK